ncbi:VWA domain-containing protein [bacterium SCSIO 12696]|nr:VWA domain-containing protein [bacterium SCSIO 12696]
MADLELLANFHLLRPWWLLAIPVGIALLWLSRKRLSSGDWAKVIDARWLPFMVESATARKHQLWPWITALIIAAVALSGPTWQQLPQPLHKDQGALVILLDLSPSMQAQDLKPNRITRARYKLRDILQQRKQGQTALIVYSANAHVVTPLTDDTATIVSQLPVLTPSLLSPAGSNTEAALDLALQLLRNSRITRGDLLLITDGVASKARTHIYQALRGSDYRLSVLALGTEQGAPIALPDGGFAKDRDGNIVIPRLDRPPLIQLAQRNSGQYSDLAADNRDIDALMAHISSAQSSPFELQRETLQRTFDSWHDQGYWLALLLLPLVVLAFRRGAVTVLMVAPLITLGSVQPSHADEADTRPPGFEQLPDVLQTPDQRGQKAFREKRFEDAAEAFQSPQWRGSAAYRAGDYKTALEAFQQDDSATGLYNQGNALAQLGQLEEAIKRYEQALAKDPNLSAAAANKALVEQAQKQQQQQSQQDEGHEGSGDQQQGEDSSGSPQQSQQDSPSESEGDSQQQSNPQQSSADDQQGEQSPDQQGQPSEDQQQASEQNSSEGEQQPGNEEQKPVAGSSSDNSDEEAERAMEQFLRKVPDDPGAFLREKFRRQQQRQQRQNQPERW